MTLTLVFSSYMLFMPAHWLYKLMELTKTSLSFKLLILVVAAVGFVASYAGEKWLFPYLARQIGLWKARVLKRTKKRKQYKVVLEGQ